VITKCFSTGLAATWWDTTRRQDQDRAVAASNYKTLHTNASAIGLFLSGEGGKAELISANFYLGPSLSLFSNQKFDRFKAQQSP